MEHVYSIPHSNMLVERVFSKMRNLWMDERYQLSIPMIEAELCVRYNLVYSCEELLKMEREKQEVEFQVHIQVPQIGEGKHIRFLYLLLCVVSVLQIIANVGIHGLYTF